MAGTLRTSFTQPRRTAPCSLAILNSWQLRAQQPNQQSLGHERVLSARRDGTRNSVSPDRAEQSVNPRGSGDERPLRLLASGGGVGRDFACRRRQARCSRDKRREPPRTVTRCQNWRRNEKSPGVSLGLVRLPWGRMSSIPGQSSCGDRIRTCDLEVMSLASYRAAPPRDGKWPAIDASRRSRPLRPILSAPRSLERGTFRANRRFLDRPASDRAGELAFPRVLPGNNFAQWRRKKRRALQILHRF